MALVYKDRVKETSTTTGTGAYTLLGAVTDFVAFSVIGNGNTCYYTATMAGSGWEVGIGTWSTGGTLARTSILASSNADAAVSWGAGTKTIFLTHPAAAIYSNPITTRGDLVRGGVGGVAERVALGTSGTVVQSDGTDVVFGAAPFPKGHMHGLRVRYSSATAVVVEAGQARDSADAYNLTLAAESTVSITTIAAALGLDETTLATTATTHGTATFEPAASIYSEAAFTGTVKTLTGTGLAGAATTITGTGTRFLAELAPGDLIRSAAKGAARVTAIASDTSLTIAAAFPGGNPSGDVGALTAYENVVIRIAAETPRRVNTISHDGLSVVCASAWTSNTSGVAIKVGGEMASVWYYAHLVYGGSGTSAILSTQRTRPYGVTGYTTAYRRVPHALWNNSSSDITIFETSAGGPLRYVSWGATGSGEQRLLASASSTSLVKVETHTGGAPPTAFSINVSMIIFEAVVSAATYVKLKIAPNRSGTILCECGVHAGTASSTAGTFWGAGNFVPLEAAGGFDYQFEIGAAASLSNTPGFIDSAGWWEAS